MYFEREQLKNLKKMFLLDSNLCQIWIIRYYIITMHDSSSAEARAGRDSNRGVRMPFQLDQETRGERENWSETLANRNRYFSKNQRSLLWQIHNAAN